MTTHSHFKGKEALDHILEKKNDSRNQGELHGFEIGGFWGTFTDALREFAILFLLLSLPLSLYFPSINHFLFLLAFSSGFLVWKTGKSGWLAWSRLERLHRLIEQEKYEIENHRPQEREELLALYRSKGFQGKLLEEVCDVLMADQDRLLKVMLEEEMGLTLEAYEHPLETSLGSFFGSVFSFCFCSFFLFFYPLRLVSWPFSPSVNRLFPCCPKREE